jgi:hypothetical protein
MSKLPSQILLGFNIMILASLGDAGEWQVACSENDKAIIKSQVLHCGPSLAKRTFPRFPGEADFKKYSSCQSGCTCSVFETRVIFVRSDEFLNCQYTTVVEIVQDDIYIGPASACQKSCGRCSTSKCRFKCGSVTSLSCLFQMGEIPNSSAGQTQAGPGISVGYSNKISSSSPSSPVPKHNGSEEVINTSILKAVEIVEIVSGILGAIAAAITVLVFFCSCSPQQ